MNHKTISVDGGMIAGLIMGVPEGPLASFVKADNLKIIQDICMIPLTYETKNFVPEEKFFRNLFTESS